ncbi:hypothetical protein [Aeromonas phage 59.1]|nr:hypothetical protein [Aeromonas phage 59.1]
MAIAPPPTNAKMRALASLDVAAVAAPVQALTSRDDKATAALNFKVSPEFKRRLKMWALENDTTMVEAMVSVMTQHMENS